MPARLRDAHVRHPAMCFADPHARPMGAGLELKGRRWDGSGFPCVTFISLEQPLFANVRDLDRLHELDDGSLPKCGELVDHAERLSV